MEILNLVGRAVLAFLLVTGAITLLAVFVVLVAEDLASF